MNFQHSYPSPPRIVASGGPVSRALRVMQGADLSHPRIVDFRRSLAARIEADLALLDALDGDPDLDADYTTTERAPDGSLFTLGRSTDDEPSLCGITATYPSRPFSLVGLHPDDSGEDLEAVNEDGTDDAEAWA